MNGFVYKLILLEPVLANSLGGDPNSARTLPFVPGAVMRGAVIRAYQAKNKLRELDATDEETRRLFFNGATRYLHAYPKDNKTENRSLPSPLSWRKLKNIDWSRGESDDKRRLLDLRVEIPTKGEQFKGMGEGVFWVLREDTAYGLDRAEQINLHTQRDSIKGKATEEHGAIFRYEALPVGMQLMGVILTQSEKDAEKVKGLIDGQTVYLGKSRTAGYGLVKIEVVEELKELFYSWSEYKKVYADPEAYNPDYDNQYEKQDAAQFTLTMLSETIVRNDEGQYTLDPIPAICSQLKLSEDYEIRTKPIFRQAEVVGGFNRKWRMPLPQTIAIAAGSVFVIESNLPIHKEQLHRLMDEGIGERRAEGMGRVAIDWIVDPPMWWRKSDAGEIEELKSNGTIDKLREDEKLLAVQMLTRFKRRELDRMLLDAIADLSVKGDVPNSQLSRWRTVLHNAMTKETPDAQIAQIKRFWIKEENKKSRAWEKMHRARLNPKDESSSPRLTEWIDEVLINDNSFWKWANGGHKSSPLELGEEVKVEVTTDLNVEYRIRLIDGVLARKAKEQSRRAQ